MNKLIKLIIALGIMGLLYQFFVTLAIHYHNVSYYLKEDDNVYEIEEDYQKKGDNDLYNFKVTDSKNNVYVFSNNTDFNKQERIIKQIRYFEENNVNCIYPIYKKKHQSELICRKDDSLVSYTYLKSINSQELNHFEEILNLDNHKIEQEPVKVAKSSNGITSYTSIKNNSISLWNGKGIYLVNNKGIKEYQLLEKDRTENDLSRLVDKYYVTCRIENNNLYTIEFVNMKEGGKGTIDIFASISSNFYINGVVGNKLYITDRTNRKQYSIYPFDKKITQIEPKSYINGKLVDTSIDELIKNDDYFITNDINEGIRNRLGNVMVKKSNGNYYYIGEDFGVYMIVGNNYEYSVLLFKLNNFKELKVIGDTIFGISGNTVYMYDRKDGLRKVIDYNKLTGNNIYEVYGSK